MSTISIIVAIDENNAIGNNNQLLCHLPNDLKYFKGITSGHPIIMGRNTFESLPNGALPNRRNIVLSKNKNYRCDKCELSSTLKEAIDLCKTDNTVFIIGGATVYNEAIEEADQLYITYIHHTFDEADTFFPKIDLNVWEEVSRTKHEQDEKNKYPHSFVLYKRIKNKKR